MRRARPTGGAWFVCCMLLHAAGRAHLDGWTRHGSVAAEHTAVAGLRFQPRLAARAIVKEDACISRHRFPRLMAAIWTGDGGCQIQSFTLPSDEIIPSRGRDEGKQSAVERSERERSVEVIPEQNASKRSEQNWGDVPMF